jgi:hypothetical protein
MTDTWSSTDGASHAVDLLYDDCIGMGTNCDGPRGFEFPGQSAFSAHTAGDSVPGPTATPGSILVKTNVNAADGDPNEAVGSITFSSAPSEFRFVSGGELEEHNLVSVPAGGSASLTYSYAVGYSVADVRQQSLTAQDHFQAPSLAITSPGNGTIVSTPTVTVTGSASSGSGIASLSVGGQSVAVGPGGAWSAQVPLNPGTNTITALATDGAGVTAQTAVTVIYQPPAPPPAPPAPVCKVPRTKGMKLAAVKRALHRNHCRVGRIVWRHSRTIRRGRVMGTAPRAGRRLHAGSRVELFVSKGK